MHRVFLVRAEQKLARIFHHQNDFARGNDTLHEKKTAQIGCHGHGSIQEMCRGSRQKHTCVCVWDRCRQKKRGQKEHLCQQRIYMHGVCVCVCVCTIRFDSLLSQERYRVRILTTPAASYFTTLQVLGKEFGVAALDNCHPAIQHHR
jgi:hypothetical protein